MSRMRMFAVFNLAVAALAVVLVVSLVPILGWQRAHGGMAVLGLTGLGVLFFLKRPGQVIADERDLLIQRRSQNYALVAFWMAFIAAICWLAPTIYGQDGAVPVSIAQLGVWWAWILIQGTMSITALVQYAGGSWASNGKAK